MATELNNPYAPPKTVPADQRRSCPVCGTQVGFWRFAFPFGYCPRCLNYLAIRNWNRSSVAWFLVLAAVLLLPIGSRLLFRREVDWLDAAVFPLMLVVLVLHFVSRKIAGRLVPAICWGFFALPDDDRLTSRVPDEPR